MKNKVQIFFSIALLNAILFLSCSGIAQNKYVLMNETFDNPVGALPPGWSVMGSGASNWGVYNNSSAGGAAPEMRMNWSPSFVGESRLITGVLDTEGATSFKLSLNIFLHYYGLSHTIKIGYSTDNGATWTDFWQQVCTGDYGPVLDEHYFNIPAEPSFILGFYYSGDSYNIWDYNLDNVKVEAIVNDDLAGVSVTGNTYPVINEPSVYEVTVFNAGSQAVNGSDYSVKLYTQGGVLVDASPGLTIEPATYETFSLTWTPGQYGAATLYGYVDFANDLYTDNNTTPNLNVNVQWVEVNEITIGTDLTTNPTTPFYLWYSYSFTQTIYVSSEINNPEAVISQIGYHYAGASQNLETDIEVWLEHTNLPSITASVPLTNATKVYEGVYAIHPGSEFSWIETDPFIYNGSDNLILTIIEKRPGYYSADDVFYSTEVPAGQNLCIGAHREGTPYDPQNLPSGDQIDFRANTKLLMSAIPPFPVVNITPDSLDFGEVELTLSKALNASIQNVGGEPLEITGVNISNSNFSISNLEFPVLIESAETIVFEVIFHPTEPQPEEGTITFLMDESVPGGKTLDVSGQGLRFGVLREGFEDTLFPPLGWKVIDLNTDLNGWYRNVTDAPTGQTVPHTGIAAAGLDTYAGSPWQTAYDDWLITPKMIWQDGDIFSFWIKRLADQSGQIWHILLSSDGNEPSDFTEIDVITDPPMNYTEKSYDLSNYGLTDGDEFYLAFQFTGLWCWPGVIDDVMASVIVRYDYDLMMLDFSGPDILHANATGNYAFTFANWGYQNVQGADYTLQLCAVINGVETILASLPGQDIASNGVLTVNIPLNVAQTGIYYVYGKIDFAADEDQGNNLTNSIKVDVIPPSFVVKNIGDFPLNQETEYTNLYPINFADSRKTSLSQTLYYNNELNTGGIIDRIGYYSLFGTNVTERKIKIWISETGAADLSGTYIPVSQMTLVYDSIVDFSAGLGRSDIIFTNPFVYSGSGNLLVTVFYYFGPDYNTISQFATKLLGSGPERTLYDIGNQLIDPENPSPFLIRTPNFTNTTLMFETFNGLGNLTGRVLYQTTQSPVDGALVTIENLDVPGAMAHVFTNDQGYFTAPYTLAGNNLKVTVHKYGYVNIVVENVNLPAGGSLDMGNLYLIESPIVSLSGTVIKSDTQTAAEGALVKLTGMNTYEATTNADGQFFFPAIWGLTSYEMTISLAGYQTYTASIQVEDIPLVLDPVTIQENAPPPHLLTATETGGYAQLNWYGAGVPFPKIFRYDDGELAGNLITTSAPNNLIGSSWKYNAIVNTVSWFTSQSGGYPPSPQVMITVLGLNADGSPNPANVLLVQDNVQNPMGWNTFSLPSPVFAPTGFFFGISGYSDYIVVGYDDGVGEPWIWQPMTQWSNGMGAYYPLENVTAPPLYGNIFMRATGLIYEECIPRELVGSQVYMVNTDSKAVTFICEPVEPSKTAEPEIPEWAFKIPEGKSFQHYNIYRKLAGVTEWEQINTNPVSDTTYIDTEWENLGAGFYQYAVEAEYTNGVKSAMAESNLLERLPVNIAGHPATQLSIFPNPSSGQFTIQSPSTILKIKVLDHTGKQVAVHTPGTHHFILNLTGQPGGVFILRIETRAGGEILKVVLVD